jgi:hypothetical protein
MPWSYSRGSFSLWPLSCPACNVPLWLSGWVFILAGALTFALLSMILCPEAEALAVACACIFGALGIGRLIRQWVALRKQKRLN